MATKFVTVPDDMDWAYVPRGYNSLSLAYRKRHRIGRKLIHVLRSDSPL